MYSSLTISTNFSHRLTRTSAINPLNWTCKRLHHRHWCSEHMRWSGSSAQQGSWNWWCCWTGAKTLQRTASCSLHQPFKHVFRSGHFPPCLKFAMIILVQKQPVFRSLIDYQPVALTPIFMKCFEQLVLAHRKHLFLRGPISVCLQDKRWCHLTGTLPFTDYSSAFSTMPSIKLTLKLNNLGIKTHLCYWKLDFFTTDCVHGQTLFHFNHTKHWSHRTVLSLFLFPFSCMTVNPPMIPSSLLSLQMTQTL